MDPTKDLKIEAAENPLPKAMFGEVSAGFILGSAVYDKHVVVGTGSQVNIYSL